MERSIVTQSAVQPVLFGLNEVSANLAAHENEPLTRAHGLNMLQIAPGTKDSEGNPIDAYYDDNGQVIGDYFLVFTVNNKIYYAPANDSTLAGQEPSTGLGSYSDQSALAKIGKNIAWITDITTGELRALEDVNDNILLSHIQKGYWEAHGGITIIDAPEGIFDSIGRCIGYAKARLSYAGIIYEIPCDFHLGGPSQRLQVGPFSPKSKHVNSPGGGGPDYNYVATPVVIKGQKPYTFTYSYWKSNTYDAHELANDEIVTIPWIKKTDGGMRAQIDGATGAITFISGAPGSDSLDAVQVRLEVATGSGTTHQDITGVDITFQFQVQDHPASGCWFCTEADKTLHLNKQDWQLIGSVEQEVFRLAPRPLTSYVKHGQELVERMVAAGVRADHFEMFTRKIIRMAQENQIREAALFYVHFVGDALRNYWPDTKFRGFRHYLDGLNSRRLVAK